METNYNRVPVRSSAILTNSYVDGTVLDGSVVNPQYNKQIAFFINFTIGSLTSMEAIVYGSVNGTNYVKLHNVAEYSFTATGTYVVSVPAVTPYVKIAVKGTGTATDSLCDITAICSDTPFPIGQLQSFDSAGNTETTLATPLSNVNDSITVYPKGASYKYQAAAADNVVVSATPATLLAIVLGANIANASIEISDHASDGDGAIVALPAGGAGTDDLLTQTLASKFKGVITFGPTGIYHATGICCDQIAQTNVTYIYIPD